MKGSQHLIEPGSHQVGAETKQFTLWLSSLYTYFAAGAWVATASTPLQSQLRLSIRTTQEVGELL